MGFNPENLSSQIEAFSQDPVLQGTVVAVSTFILEDVVSITCGLLVADGRLGFMTALIGLSIGIAVGDLGLYMIGRFLAPRFVAWGFVRQETLEKGKLFAEENLLEAIILSRFMPGTRIPTYMGAGFVRASLVKFILVALLASTLWSFTLLLITVNIGAAIFPLLGKWRWPIVIAVVGGAIFLGARRRRRRASAEQEAPDQAPVASSFEFWHPVLFYFPVACHYFWLALRYRSLTLPTCANPSIYSGGWTLESKSQILGLIPDVHRKQMAACVLVGPDSSPQRRLAAALESMKAVGIVLPAVAKPDIGQRGAGVQLVRDEAALEEYFHRFPATIDVIVQEFANFPEEAGVFYVRRPGEERGKILSVTRKEFPFVTGDGRRTLSELIEADARLRLVARVYHERHAARLGEVLAEGEVLPLVFAGNHCQGAIFRDGGGLVTPELEAVIDGISRSIPEFYFGRFDIRFRDEESFSRGMDFKIVELNGASAEMTHIWDPGMKLQDAWMALFEQFRILFAIGDANRRRGHKPIGPVQFVKDFLHYRRISREYPPTS